MTEEREQYQALPEAPTTVNVRFYYHRFDVQFTIREHDVNKLWKKLTFLIETNLIPNPAVQPKFGNNAPSSEKPKAEAKAEDDEEHPDEKLCPIHGVMMKKRTKDGQIWYSHVLGKDETGKNLYCNGKEK